MRRRAAAGQAAFDWRRPGPAAGVDEAGRGPLAGPVTAAAVILDPQRPIDGLADSKALAPARREALAGAFNAGARAYALTHIRCTDASRTAIELKLSEGAAIARRLVNRYGN